MLCRAKSYLTDYRTEAAGRLPALRVSVRTWHDRYDS